MYRPSKVMLKQDCVKQLKIKIYSYRFIDSTRGKNNDQNIYTAYN